MTQNYRARNKSP